MIAGRIYGAGNADGLPADWLAETIEIKRADDAPDGWIVFQDQAEVDAYLSALKVAYDSAIALRPVDPQPLTLTSLDARVTALENK